MGHLIGTLAAVREGERCSRAGPRQRGRRSAPRLPRGAARARARSDDREAARSAPSTTRSSRLRLRDRGGSSCDGARRARPEVDASERGRIGDADSSATRRSPRELGELRERGSRDARGRLGRRQGEGAAARATIVAPIAEPHELCSAKRCASTPRRLWEFVADDPRESNTEGGLFPAIFGTVMMVLIMSVVVVARSACSPPSTCASTRGRGRSCAPCASPSTTSPACPSIVFGVFGLGFFVYFVGGGDRPAVLPRGAADADLRHRRHPVGVAHAGAAHRAGGDRRHRGGAGRGAARRCARLARAGRHQVRDHPARRAAGRRCPASSPASSWRWRAAPAKWRR